MQLSSHYNSEAHTRQCFKVFKKHVDIQQASGESWSGQMLQKKDKKRKHSSMGKVDKKAEANIGLV